MAYGLSIGHVTDDVTWPPKVLWGSTIGYPSDSLASCLYIMHSQIPNVTKTDGQAGRVRAMHSIVR